MTQREAQTRARLLAQEFDEPMGGCSTGGAGAAEEGRLPPVRDLPADQR